MNQLEYRQEMHEINKRFDAQIAAAERDYNRAVADCKREQESFNAWLENYYATRRFSPLLGLKERYETAESEIVGRRANLDKARAAELRTADIYQSLLANKKSWVTKLDNRFRESFLADGLQTVEQQLAGILAQ
jgi:hypothetical protein